MKERIILAYNNEDYAKADQVWLAVLNAIPRTVEELDQILDVSIEALEADEELVMDERYSDWALQLEPRVLGTFVLDEPYNLPSSAQHPSRGNIGIENPSISWSCYLPVRNSNGDVTSRYEIILAGKINPDDSVVYDRGVFMGVPESWVHDDILWNELTNAFEFEGEMPQVSEFKVDPPPVTKEERVRKFEQRWQKKAEGNKTYHTGDELILKEGWYNTDDIEQIWVEEDSRGKISYVYYWQDEDNLPVYSMELNDGRSLFGVTEDHIKGSEVSEKAQKFEEKWKKKSSMTRTAVDIMDVWNHGEYLDDWAIDWNPATNEFGTNGGMEYQVKYLGKHYFVDTEMDGNVPLHMFEVVETEDGWVPLEGSPEEKARKFEERWKKKSSLTKTAVWVLWDNRTHTFVDSVGQSESMEELVRKAWDWYTKQMLEVGEWDEETVASFAGMDTRDKIKELEHVDYGVMDYGRGETPERAISRVEKTRKFEERWKKKSSLKKTAEFRTLESLIQENPEFDLPSDTRVIVHPCMADTPEAGTKEIQEASAARFENEFTEDYSVVTVSGALLAVPNSAIMVSKTNWLPVMERTKAKEFERRWKKRSSLDKKAAVTREICVHCGEEGEYDHQDDEGGAGDMTLVAEGYLHWDCFDVFMHLRNYMKDWISPEQKEKARKWEEKWKKRSSIKTAEDFPESYGDMLNYIGNKYGYSAVALAAEVATADFALMWFDQEVHGVGNNTIARNNLIQMWLDFMEEIDSEGGNGQDVAEALSQSWGNSGQMDQGQIEQALSDVFDIEIEEQGDERTGISYKITSGFENIENNPDLRQPTRYISPREKARKFEQRWQKKSSLTKTAETKTLDQWLNENLAVVVRQETSIILKECHATHAHTGGAAVHIEEGTSGIFEKHASGVMKRNWSVISIDTQGAPLMVQNQFILVDSNDVYNSELELREESIEFPVGTVVKVEPGMYRLAWGSSHNDSGWIITEDYVNVPGEADGTVRGWYDGMYYVYITAPRGVGYDAHDGLVLVMKYENNKLKSGMPLTPEQRALLFEERWKKKAESNFKIGDRVRIKLSPDDEDYDTLNGAIGTLAVPFSGLAWLGYKPDFGIRLEEGFTRIPGAVGDDIANVQAKDIERIMDPEEWEAKWKKKASIIDTEEVIVLDWFDFNSFNEILEGNDKRKLTQEEFDSFRDWIYYDVGEMPSITEQVLDWFAEWQVETGKRAKSWEEKWKKKSSLEKFAEMIDTEKFIIPMCADKGDLEDRWGIKKLTDEQFADLRDRAQDNDYFISESPWAILWTIYNDWLEEWKREHVKKFEKKWQKKASPEDPEVAFLLAVKETLKKSVEVIFEKSGVGIDAYAELIFEISSDNEFYFSPSRYAVGIPEKNIDPGKLQADPSGYAADFIGKNIVMLLSLAHEVGHYLDLLTRGEELITKERNAEGRESELSKRDYIVLPSEQMAYLREIQVLKNMGYSNDEIIDYYKTTPAVPQESIQGLLAQAKAY